jgi:DNA-binding CsgD family transcriptional regulator
MDPRAGATPILQEGDGASVSHPCGGTRRDLPQQPSLTVAQHRIMADLVEGYSQKEVAARHGLSRETVHCHLARLRVRYGARSIVQLVAHLVRMGLLCNGMAVAL